MIQSRPAYAIRPGSTTNERIAKEWQVLPPSEHVHGPCRGEVRHEKRCVRADDEQKNHALVPDAEQMLPVGPLHAVGEGGRRVRRHEREGVQAAGHRDGPVGTARQQGDPAGHAEHHPGGVRERVGEFLMLIAGRMRSGAVHDVRETGGCNERSAGC